MVIAWERPLGTQHRLEAYATLTFRSVKRCLKKHLPEGPRTNVNHADRLMIGVGRANAPPPSEPDWQFSSVRLSS
jgi:hypothetical protein